MRDAHRRWAVILAGCALAAVVACSRGPRVLQFTGPAMGTTYSLTVAHPPPGVSRRAIEQVVTEVLRETDRHLSGWNAGSEVVRFNATRTTRWQAVSPVLLEVAVQAQRISGATGGAFDPTVAPLVQAWGFGAGAGTDVAVPRAETVARLQERVGYARLEWRAYPPGLRKQVADLTLDLDGIAPGWAVDRIGARLEALGIVDYLVELGGEVRARGRHPDGRTWRVAVEVPRSGERRPYALIELEGLGVSTSGDYRDFRDVGGRRISHTIDPRSGAPVTHGLASVTVVNTSTGAADAWATALLVLGPEEGMALARRSGLAALFIVRDRGTGGFASVETPEFGRLRVAPGATL